MNEFVNWKDHKVFEEIENEGQRAASVLQPAAKIRLVLTSTVLHRWSIK